MKTTTNVIYGALAGFAFACFALSPSTRAVVPAPDGGYPNGNTAEGQSALLHLTSGGFNTAVGYLSLSTDSTNGFNTAIGAGALLLNTAGENTATGAAALLSNSTGDYNTADGAFALFSNTIGYSTTAIGSQALFHNTEGDANTAIGAGALYSLTTGSLNIALGGGAGNQLTTGSNNIDIGNNGDAGDASTIRIGSGQGATYIAGIDGATIDPGTALAVGVDANGKLGTASSSRRFKRDINQMGSASEAILALKPVTFHYKSDVKSIPCFGLVAEDVEKVNPDLVVRDKEGKPYSVRYDQVNAMLLNEFLKEHKTVQEQGAIIARQQKQIEALTAGLQKVSAQLEVSKSAPQTVVNSR